MLDRNRAMLQMRREGLTYAHIGRTYGLSTQRVRQIVFQTEVRLRQQLSDRHRRSLIETHRLPFLAQIQALVPIRQSLHDLWPMS